MKEDVGMQDVYYTEVNDVGRVLSMQKGLYVRNIFQIIIK